MLLKEVIAKGKEYMLPRALDMVAIAEEGYRTES